MRVRFSGLVDGDDLRLFRRLDGGCLDVFHTALELPRGLGLRYNIVHRGEKECKDQILLSYRQARDTVQEDFDFRVLEGVELGV
jgi:hypothetical protein